MRRVIIAIAAAAAILLPGATIAAAPASAQTPSNECENYDIYFQNYEGAWLHVTGSSHTVIATKSESDSKTGWCVIHVSGNLFMFEQYQTYRCLTVGSNHTIVSGACTSANEDDEWLVYPSVYANSTPWKLLEDQGNRECIYQNGLGNPVTYKACVNQRGTTGDVWVLNS